MKRPRFTVRTMMILVAIVAVGIGLWGTFVRARHFQSEAKKHVLEERRWEAGVMRWEKFLADVDRKWPIADYKSRPEQVAGIENTRKQILAVVGQCRRGNAKERLLRMKYERAARHPWLSVEPDKP